MVGLPYSYMLGAAASGETPNGEGRLLVIHGYKHLTPSGVKSGLVKGRRIDDYRSVLACNYLPARTS